MQQQAKNAVLWDALDLISVTGTVGGAAMVALGYNLLFASLPIALPAFSLFVGIRRERQRSQARDVFDEMLMDDLSHQREALAQVQNEIETVSAKIEGLLNGKLKIFEEKLDRIEGTLVSTSGVKLWREGMGGGIMKRISDLQQQTVIYAVSSEFRSLFEQWGTSQLQSIGEVSNRLKFVEESIDRLQSYDFAPNSSSYDLPGASAIEVTAERREAKQEGSSVLGNMKEVIAKELSSVLKQLKDNQVDMMQSLRDVRMNPIPQADYSFLEKQLERIEAVLGNLPQQLSETFNSDAPSETLKEAYSKQFAAISAVVQNLEGAIGELKRASAGESETSQELDVLEQKWMELRSLMHALSDQIAGVNERMEQIMQQPERSMAFEAEDEGEKVEEPVGAGEAESSQEFLEFQDSSGATLSNLASPNGAPDSLEDTIYNDPLQETDDRFLAEREVKQKESLYPSPGLLSEPSEEEGTPVSDQNGRQDVVSKVGNVTVGLELLKKGRLALEEDYGEASKHLVGALEQFESILEVDPTNIKCLGNCGNALLALGELKLRMSRELQTSDPDAPKSSKSALQQLQQESQQFLTLAGRRFKALLENKADDKRAYMNWGKALCMRAHLTAEPSTKMQLYDAAIVKYEQILSFAPDFADALFFCGMALKESSEVQLGSPMESRSRLNQAVVYFESVGRLAPSSQLQFEAFQMIQECRQLAGSPTLI